MDTGWKQPKSRRKIELLHQVAGVDSNSQIDVQESSIVLTET